MPEQEGCISHQRTYSHLTVLLQHDVFSLCQPGYESVKQEHKSKNYVHCDLYNGKKTMSTQATARTCLIAIAASQISHMWTLEFEVTKLVGPYSTRSVYVCKMPGLTGLYLGTWYSCSNKESGSCFIFQRESIMPYFLQHSKYSIHSC